MGDEQAIHTEPLIRRERPYQYFQPNERRAIFSKLYYFTLNCDIKYKAFVFLKSEYENKFKLEARIARELSQFIRGNLLYFQGYEKVMPSDYRLFQVADLICTLELLRIKKKEFKKSAENSGKIRCF